MTAIAVVARISVTPGALPRITMEAGLAAAAEPATRGDVGTITEVRRSADCGIFIGVAEVRYGDRFGMLVPCIELHMADGLPFAVGDTHRVLVDDDDIVRAIEWNGRRYTITTALPAVKTPAAAIGHITAMDPAGHHRAPGWRWDAARLHD